MPFAHILPILAFAGATLAGILCIYFAFHYERFALLAWAVAAFFGGITGLLFAGSADPDGGIRPLKAGGKFTGLPDGIIFADMRLVVAANALSFIIH